MEKSKKTFKIKYHIFQYNVIVNTLMNSNNKKFKDHLHNFFNKTNVMYKWPTKSVFVQWARKLQWWLVFFFTLSLWNEVWDKVDFRFNTKPPKLWYWQHKEMNFWDHASDHTLRQRFHFVQSIARLGSYEFLKQ